MHDVWLASRLADRRMRELWSGPASHPYRYLGVSRPVRRSARGRLADRWSSHRARTASSTRAVPAT